MGIMGIRACPECGRNRLVRDYVHGELVCADCGYVIAERIVDMGPEWRAFDQEQRDRRERVGAPTIFTIHDKGLSTLIDPRNRDSFGKVLTPERRAQVYRLRKWQGRGRASSAVERNLVFALCEIDRMASNLSLPRNVREAAAIIYRQVVDGRLIRGHSIEGVAGAALYAACRQCRFPRTLDEIAGVSGVGKKKISRSYRSIARRLLIHLHPTSPADYVPRFASELGLGGEVQSRAVALLKKAERGGLTAGRGPAGVAAAAVYVAALTRGERLEQEEVARVARITSATLRARYKELCRKLRIDLRSRRGNISTLWWARGLPPPGPHPGRGSAQTVKSS